MTDTPAAPTTPELRWHFHGDCPHNGELDTPAEALDVTLVRELVAALDAEIALHPYEADAPTSVIEARNKGRLWLSPHNREADHESDATESRTEAGRTLCAFACWEFHAFDPNAHNASCGRVHELTAAIEDEARDQKYARAIAAEYLRLSPHNREAGE